MQRKISIRLSESMVDEAIQGLLHQKQNIAYVMTTPMSKREFDKLTTRYGRIISTITLLQEKKNRVCPGINSNMIKNELHLKGSAVNFNLNNYESN